MLNAAGYGQPGTGLELDLVYNPNGAFLAPQQATLEEAYRYGAALCVGTPGSVDVPACVAGVSRVRATYHCPALPRMVAFCCTFVVPPGWCIVMAAAI